MPSEKDKKLLREVVNGLNFNIPDTVFQFDFNRSTSVQYLLDHPEVPFILRSSSYDEYFSLDIPSLDRNGFRIALILPKENEFKVGFYKHPVFTELRNLEEHIKKYWDPEINRMIFDEERVVLTELKAKKAWEQFKLSHQQNQEHQIAVLSIQSLDTQKIALSPNELHTYEQNNIGMQHVGDGHTGFAMAKALNAPFVVVRSEENREESNKILQPHIGDNGLIVVTGHGKPGGDEIQGSYDALDFLTSFINSSDAQTLYKQQIERGPNEIVSTAMDAGLISGNHITIVLSICYGASDTSVGTSDSFAHKLAREFASQGISSTIISSDKSVIRFGTNAIVDEKITFNNKVGMAAEDVYVFTTEVNGPNSNPQISIYKPYETIQLTQNGIVFVNSNALQITSSKNAQIAQQGLQQGSNCFQKINEEIKQITQEEFERSKNQTKEKSYPQQVKGQQNLQQLDQQPARELSGFLSGLKNIDIFKKPQAGDVQRSKVQAEERKQLYHFFEKRKEETLLNEQDIKQQGLKEECSSNCVSNRSNCV